MLSRRSPLLTRLRRHRGWFALVFAVLLIKLVSSSVCLGDGVPHVLTAAPGTAAVMAATTADAADACLLGEGADCHCACAHSLTVTSSGVAAAPASMPAVAPAPRAIDAQHPAFHGSLLRPPIA